MIQVFTIRQIQTSLTLVLVVLTHVMVSGQVYSNKEVGKKNQEYIDSLKATEWPYALPILGKKATKAGFNLPYPYGININYLWQESDLIIDNLQIGFNNAPMRDMSEVVRFNDATSTAQGVNFRPDAWLLPFLNVYGIFAFSRPSTTVDFEIFAPDAEGNWSSVMAMSTKAEFEATTLGFGLTPTIGVGGGWLALDMNFTWSDIPALKEPAFATVFGPRLGKAFKLKKPESNIAVWVGGFRLHLNTGTSGSLPLNELIETEGLQARVNNGLDQVATKASEVESWWNSLSPPEQKNPVNVAKYETANRALATAGTFLNGLDEALNDEQHATVQYALDKRPADMWNFTVGSQYQYNKHVMFRAEFGFLGSRQQLITGIQYRFGF